MCSRSQKGNQAELWNNERTFKLVVLFFGSQMSGNEAEENIISKFKWTSATSLALNAKLAPKGQAGKSWVIMLVIAANVSPSKKMGDRTRQSKNLWPRRESNPRPPDLIVRCSTDWATRPDGRKSWVIIVVISFPWWHHSPPLQEYK